MRLIQILVLLNIVILLVAISLLIMGGLFYCTTSYLGQYYGNITTFIAFIITIFIYLLSITKDGKLPLGGITSIGFIITSVILSIVSSSLSLYNILNHKSDIINKRVNINYYIMNGLYILSLCLIVFYHIMSLTQIYFTGETKIQKYIILLMSIFNLSMSYYSYTYLET